MAASRTSVLFRHLREALLLPDGAGLTDGQLLECFLLERNEAAFEVLVHRHGPMVMGVCRRLIGNLHDAEDAFQASFLVLAQGGIDLATRGGWELVVRRCLPHRPEGECRERPTADP